MDAIATLGTLLGLALVSGVRLYSTILAVGLGIRWEFFTLPPALSSLAVLGETPILLLAGAIYTIEFVADKIPWVDSLWDSVHTFIRPLGAGLLAATAMGEVNPVVKVGAALLCGGVALSSHSTKAGTRIVANHSPEPFSNIGLSLAEDGIVLGGVWLAVNYPLVALGIAVAAVGLAIWLIPRIIRLVRRQGASIRELATGRWRRLAEDPLVRS
jgi:hypothetical protein